METLIETFKVTFQKRSNKNKTTGEYNYDAPRTVSVDTVGGETSAMHVVFAEHGGFRPQYDFKLRDICLPNDKIKITDVVKVETTV